MDNKPGSIFSFKSLSWHLVPGRHRRRKHKQKLEQNCLPGYAVCTGHTLLKDEDLTGTPYPQIVKLNRKNVVWSTLYSGYPSAHFRWNLAGCMSESAGFFVTSVILKWRAFSFGLLLWWIHLIKTFRRLSAGCPDTRPSMDYYIYSDIIF